MKLTEALENIKNGNHVRIGRCICGYRLCGNAVLREIDGKELTIDYFMLEDECNFQLVEF